MSGKHPVKPAGDHGKPPIPSPEVAGPEAEVWVRRRRLGVALFAVLATCGLLACLAGAAGAATTSFDRGHTILMPGFVSELKAAAQKA